MGRMSTTQRNRMRGRGKKLEVIEAWIGRMDNLFRFMMRFKTILLKLLVC